MNQWNCPNKPSSFGVVIGTNAFHLMTRKKLSFGIQIESAALLLQGNQMQLDYQNFCRMSINMWSYPLSCETDPFHIVQNNKCRKDHANNGAEYKKWKRLKIIKILIFELKPNQTKTSYNLCQRWNRWKLVKEKQRNKYIEIWANNGAEYINRLNNNIYQVLIPKISWKTEKNKKDKEMN